MKTETFEIETQASLERVQQILSAQLAGASLQPLQESYDPLSSGPAPHSSFLAEKMKMLWPEWSIQVALFDFGDARGVKLVALGTGGFGQGRRNSVPLRNSVQKAKEIAAALR